jgi:hypothetical protein
MRRGIWFGRDGGPDGGERDTVWLATLTGAVILIAVILVASLIW